MTDHIHTAHRNLFEVENARNLTPHEVAATFVPTQAFWRLLSPKHHIVYGARGSGKTALARMLAHDHLSLLESDEAKQHIQSQTFIGTYVPMRLEWVSALLNKPWQTESEKEQFFQWRLNVATALAFLKTAKSCMSTYLDDVAKRALAEQRFVTHLARDWLPTHLAGQITSVTTLEHEIRRLEYRRQQQLAIARARNVPVESLEAPEMGAEFSVELFAPLHHGIYTLSATLNIPDTTTWLLCLDEAEFLEEIHHRILNSYLRAHSGNLFFKITTMPYQHHTLETNASARLDEGQDFEYIYIDHDRVVDVEGEPPRESSGGGWEFARRLFSKRAEFSGAAYADISLESLLGRSRLLDPTPADWARGSHLRELLFEYCDDRTVMRAKDALSRIDQAADDGERANLLGHFSDSIGRKIRGALLLREAVANLKGAKKLDLYSGVSTFVRCGDGNPRRLVRLFNQLLTKSDWRQKAGPRISPTQQTEILQQFSKSTIERVQAEKEIGPELYALISAIGQSFRFFLHVDKLSTDQFGSVSVDRTAFADYQKLIRRAVGLGLLYPHYTEATRDQLPLVNGRFRLAYILAPHFLLLPRKGREKNLSTLLRFRPQMRRASVIDASPSGQPSLFSVEEEE